MAVIGRNRAWATIDLQALQYNLAQVRRLSPQSKLCAVIKANAYGHGMEQAARALAEGEGEGGSADCFAVATMEEAVALNMLGLPQRIVLLQGFADAAELAYVNEAGIECVIHADYQIALLKDFIARGAINKPMTLWLKIDTGMHRLGLNEADFGESLGFLQACEWVEKIIIMSHLACADAPNDQVSAANTENQITAFNQAVKPLDYLAADRVEFSLAASAGILAWPSTHYQVVRPGIMLYGGSPFADQTGADLKLQPVMSLYSRLIAINDIPAGGSIGYGATYTCKKSTRVGVVSIGYADGYPRSAPSGTPVMLDDSGVFKRCSLLGRVSMDMITIDLTDFSEASVGDRVQLWGTDLAADEVAELAGTISYELFSKVTSRVSFDYS